ncbi:CPBP family intramembrane glutamic endopeptidase [Cryptosporangium sp. NPDC048952]|uniref:CPBP family intramembrane glutamic endopeptidase n=1 Tax=Cryptosporangium sp. NPDC048952 TaxID=3363961 RepID=UPI00371D0B54
MPATILLTGFVVPGALDGLTVPSLTVLAAFLPMLVIQFLTTATAEEPGWRDFALPRLQQQFGPVLGTSILGVLWGCWHLPLFLTEWGGYPDITWTDPALFVVSCVPLSLVMTWIFNRTGQSLPIVMVFHAAINTTYSLVWPTVFNHAHPGLRHADREPGGRHRRRDRPDRRHLRPTRPVGADRRAPRADGKAGHRQRLHAVTFAAATSRHTPQSPPQD